MKKCNAIVVLLLGMNMPLMAQQATITGRVIHAENSNPLPAAHISLQAATAGGVVNVRHTVSSTAGYYEFTNVPYGRVVIETSYVGFEPFRMEMHVDRQNVQVDMALKPRQAELGEVVVTSLRKTKPLRESVLPFAVVQSGEIEARPYPTLSEMMNAQPGINLVRDGIWATSLNIRGLGENRIIAMVDGNRLETATDLAAALSLIDPADVERVEVIKGAASSLYGSGSLGGVVNIITRKAGYADSFTLKGNITSGWQSVNAMHTGRLRLEAGSRKWRASLSGNLRGADDTRTPIGELPNSQFHDRSLIADAGVMLTDKLELSAGLQHMYAGDVGIPGGLAFPATAEATYKRAIRDLCYFQLTGTPGRMLENWSVKAFYQDILRDVIVHPNTPPVETPTRITTPLYFTPYGLHRTRGISFQSQWAPGGNHSLVAGADLWSRHLFTTRTKYIQIEMLDGEGEVTAINQLERGEIPIPESRFTSAGVFFHDEISLQDRRFRLQLGGRFDAIFISNEEARDPVFLVMNGTLNETPPNQRITFPEGKEKDFSWSLNAGMLVHVTGSSDLAVSLARAYRSASLEERFKYIDLGSTVRVGDPALEPETGWSADLGWRTWTSSLELGFNAFLNRVNGLITEMPGEYIYNVYTGSDTWVTDTLPALVNTNIDRGLLTGFDLNWKVMPASRFFAGGSAGFVYARDLDSGDALPLIPPFNGNLFAGYRIEKAGQVTVKSEFAADQHRIADGERSTPGYAVYHAYVQTVPLELGPASLRLYTGVENITDRAWRNHLTSNRGTVDVEPGRNFFIRLRIDF
ncbi:MAG: TonB-dependent receptor [Bacteroidales bacterium]